MSTTTDLRQRAQPEPALDEQLLRARFEDELRAAGLALPEGERELVVSLCVSAYREDLARAARRLPEPR
ncbi:MAG: hypothetical protein JWM64_1965 [Frankiales bacterium]|nr:hypothetical protein [Frankiales bacterium]